MDSSRICKCHLAISETGYLNYLNQGISDELLPRREKLSKCSHEIFHDTRQRVYIYIAESSFKTTVMRSSSNELIPVL